MMKILSRIFSPALLWLITALACLFSPQQSWAIQVFITASTILLLGSGIAALMGLNPHRTAVRLLLASTLGLIAIMVIALAISWVLPHFGIARPLDPSTVRMSTIVALALIVILTAIFNRDAFRWLTSKMTNRSPVLIIVAGLVPALAAFGAVELNNVNNNTVALISLFVISFALIASCTFALLRTRSKRQSPFLITLMGSSALAAFWSVSLKGAGLYGWDVQKELSVANQSVQQGIFTIPTNADSYASMASLTALPAYLHSLSGIAPIDLTRWMLPVLLAIAVSGAIAMVGEKYGDGPAIAAMTILVVSTSSLARQFPAIGRQEIAILMFVALIYAISSTNEKKFTRQASIIIFALGLAISHYTTAYVSAFFLIVALLARYLLRIRKEDRKKLVITWPVVLSVLVVVIMWNGVITRPASELVTDTSTTANSGLQILGNGQSNPLTAWLVGTSQSLVPVATYEKAMLERRDATMTWLNRDVRADSLTLTDSRPSVGYAPLSRLNGAWNGGVLLLRQLLLLVTVVLLALFFIRRFKSRSIKNLEIYTVALGALALVSALRVSSTLALLYNPERGAIQAGFVFAFALAAGINYLLFSKTPVLEYVKSLPRHRLVTEKPKNTRGVLVGTFVVGWVLVNTVSGLGIERLLFSGAPLATFANVGEDYERFQISESEIATAKWIHSNFDEQTLVFADRYGELVLMSVQTPGSFRTLNLSDPKAIDVRALVYASRTNVLSHRARGCVSNICATWVYPKTFFDETRNIIYSTEETRVYGNVE